jgi:hypothetical protein
LYCTNISESADIETKIRTWSLPISQRRGRELRLDAVDTS